VNGSHAERGWWRRLRANTSNVSPWDTDDLLPRLKLEVPALRKRAAKVWRPARRKAALKADGS
jgi:hypothetical protein